ncbi:MAG: MmgE/PrpD family protein [Sphingobium sp.]|nr:MmgE/PrpD family protein [Sphingobium sp.]
MSDRSNPSRIIAKFIARLSYDDLTEQTRHAARRSLLDALGVMLAASGLAEDVRPYGGFAAGETGPCRLIGSSARTSLSGAALANGSLAHALDFGDTFDAGPAHPNAALVPALLAIADANPGIDARQFLTAMVAGSDLACRLSLAPARPYEEGGWYQPPLFNLIAGAAASAKLLGLTAGGICAAMGLAMMQGAFPAEIKYDAASPMRGVREAFAARGAVEAALLASAGARAFADPLGGQAGFFAVYGGGPPRPILLEGLGERFLGDEVSFKPWPACRGTHAYIEAALALRDRIGGREIAFIEAEIGPVQTMLIEPLAAKAAPVSAIEARFSIPYTVAAALEDGAVTLDSFLPGKLADPAMLALARKVRPSFNAAWGRTEAASGGLRIVLTDGASLEFAVTHAAGGLDRPLSDEALADKFVHCASKARTPVAPSRAKNFAAELLAGHRSHPAEWLPASA